MPANPDTPNRHADEFWEDLKTIVTIANKIRGSETFPLPPDALRIVHLAALVGNVSDQVIAYRAGHADMEHVAKSVVDLIQGGFVALGDWTMDAQEFLEIQTKETRILLEHEEH